MIVRVDSPTHRWDGGGNLFFVCLWRLHSCLLTQRPHVCVVFAVGRGNHTIWSAHNNAMTQQLCCATVVEPAAGFGVGLGLPCAGKLVTAETVACAKRNLVRFAVLAKRPAFVLRYCSRCPRRLFRCRKMVDDVAFSGATAGQVRCCGRYGAVCRVRNVVRCCRGGVVRHAVWH